MCRCRELPLSPGLSQVSVSFSVLAFLFSIGLLRALHRKDRVGRTVSLASRAHESVEQSPPSLCFCVLCCVCLQRPLACVCFMTCCAVWSAFCVYGVLRDRFFCDRCMLLGMLVCVWWCRLWGVFPVRCVTMHAFCFVRATLLLWLHV